MLNKQNVMHINLLMNVHPILITIISIMKVLFNRFGGIWPKGRDMALDQSFDLLVFCVGGWQSICRCRKGFRGPYHICSKDKEFDDLACSLIRNTNIIVTTTQKPYQQREESNINNKQ